MRRITYNTEVFTREDALSYYLLGVWYTDGTLRKTTQYHNSHIWTASLSSADRGWIRDIKNLFSTEIAIRKDKRAKLFKIDLNNEIIYRWLYNNGCIPNKSLVIDFPTIPVKYMPDFIRGCIDGDGTIRFKKQKLSSYHLTDVILCSASSKFALGYSKQLTAMGFKHSLFEVLPAKKQPSFIDGRMIVSKNILYVISVRGKTATRLAKTIYYSDDLFCLERKRKIGMKLIRYGETHRYKRHDLIDKNKLLFMLKTMTVKAIAAQYNCTFKVISRWIKLHQIPMVGKGNKYSDSPIVKGF